MRAAYYEKNGPATDVLHVGEVETPKPGQGEVRVKLATSGVNPSDVKSREGRTRKIAYPRVIPHSDGAGTIDLVGEGVPATRVGERVWVWNGQWKRPFGTAADDVTLAEAWAGATLLVSGGAGAVANYAIQFAKARGAVVIATVSSDEKAKRARAAGADHTIDYKREDVAARVKDLTDGAGVDAVIELDLAANAKLLSGVLRPKGSVIVYGTGAAEASIPAQWMLVSGIVIKFMLVYDLTMDEHQAAIAEITRMLAANSLVHGIAATFPLDKIIEAHQAVESGKAIGNVVLRIG